MATNSKETSTGAVRWIAPSPPERRPGRTLRQARHRAQGHHRVHRPGRMPARPGDRRLELGADRRDERRCARPRSRRRPRRRSAPWASDSPVTWRTTLRCGQPIALRVPSSRVRFVTEDSVSRLAIRNAASSATIVRAVPSLPARSFASFSEPPTRSARSCASVTSDEAKFRSTSRETAATSSALSARTYSVFTRFLRSASCCSWSSLR